MLDVDRVEVRGAVRTGTAEVRGAASIHPGEPMVAVRTGRATRALEALPWVAEVTVVRSWPATVVIDVEERVAAAFVDAGAGRGVLVDAGGHQLVGAGAADALAEGLPTLRGAPFDPAPGRPLGSWAAGALELAGRLDAGFADATVEVVVVDDRLEARLQGASVGDLLVRFGTSDRLEAKIAALASVVERAEPRPAVVDVQAPDAPALTPPGPDRMLSTATRGLHNYKSKVEVEGLRDTTGVSTTSEQRPSGPSDR
ncbi:MAG TPA: FtsQ-type POTRA domain-containing protein [Acidimicrobiales bacterium]|nr:FtsQ-type POTRA domain-containing protein [Acidimicrobiales bacterium]